MSQQDVVSGKHILLGITGSIAAYKAADVLRRLQERGAHVRVAMTRNATRFVGQLTFEALSGMPVLCDEFDVPKRESAIGHIQITDGLAAALVAPATANCIAKLAAGIADDSLTSALLAAECPLVVAPAMNDRMWRNQVVARNIATLRDLGVTIVEPEQGTLACGAVGQGRLAGTDCIIEAVGAVLQPADLAGRNVLVSAGPTREHIDAVRYISNPSTGKMGYALAAAARERGANVTLVSGPTNIAPPSHTKLLFVTSAAEMHETVLREAADSDIVIMAAAVSDFRPIAVAERKVKKSEAPLELQLERTVDILHELSASKGKRILVGFAAESDDLEHNASKKLHEKKLDLIVANDILRAGSGFGTDTNAVTILTRSGDRRELPVMTKLQVAREIMAIISALLKENLGVSGS